MSTYITQEGQCLLDVALELFGNADGLTDLTAANPGMEFHSAPAPGTVLKVPAKAPIDADVVRRYGTGGIVLANWNAPDPGDYNNDYSNDYDNEQV